MGTGRRGCRERRETAKPVALSHQRAISPSDEATPGRIPVLCFEAAAGREVHPEAPTVHDAPANQAGKCLSAAAASNPGEGTAAGEAEFD